MHSIVMNKYRRFFVLPFKNATEYLGSFLLQLLPTPLTLLVNILVWTYMLAGGNTIGGMGMKEMVGYFMAVTFIRQSVGSAYYVIWEMFNHINTGQLGVFLCRPISYLGYSYTKCFSNSIMQMLLHIPLFVLLRMFVGIDITVLTHLPLFILSLWMAFTMLFLIQFLIGTLSFWLKSVLNLRDVLNEWLIPLLAGGVLPLAVFPGWFQSICAVLPFKMIFDLPISLYLGTLPIAQGWEQLAYQGCWLVGLALLSGFVWKRGVRKYEAQGG